MVHPLVLQRPFKILVHNEDPIREHMAELNTRFAQGVDSVPTEAPSSISPSPWLCYYRPRITQETLQKDLLKIGLIQQNLLAEISNKNRRRHLFGVKKLC